MTDPVFLVALLVPVAIAVLITVLVLRSQGASLRAAEERMAELDARIARAAPARATVISSEAGGTFEGGALVVVDLRLEIESPARGRYQARAKWGVNLASLPLLQPGQAVPVKVDDADPERIYPDLQGARHWPR
ncbi:MAG: hypothetical protein IT372_23400 [Polyangiaceae bacterium]|nr:hypothetical protein [Polyangiaceae bacterium]